MPLLNDWLGGGDSYIAGWNSCFGAREEISWAEKKMVASSEIHEITT